MKPTYRPLRWRARKEKPVPPLQSALEAIFSGGGLAISALAQLLIAKLKIQGMVGAEKHFELIKSELGKRYRNEDGLTFEHPLTVNFDGGEGDYKVSVGPEDVEQLSKNWRKALSGAVEAASDALFAQTFQSAKQQAIDAVGRRVAESAEFRRRLASRWAKPLHLLAFQLGIAIQFGGDMSEWLRSKSSGSDAELIEALLRLHARACQIAGEVEALLQSGFADGALSRWRSLHEVSVVALFLQEKGNDVARRYLDHLAVDSCDLARKMRAASSDPDSSVTDKEMSELVAAVDVLKMKYGQEFAEEYGWAANALNNKRPNFSQIEKAVSFEKIRPYYKLASTTVHAGPKGAFWKLGLGNGHDMLLAGPSNAGLSAAGRLTAISLTHVSVALALLHPMVDSTVWGRVLLELSKEVEEAFLSAERGLERDEEVFRPSSKPAEKISVRLRRRQGA